MDKKQLFIRTLEDIERRTKSKDIYEILLIAGLLRKLLIDDYPLMDQVNEKRIKIKFRINERDTPSNDSGLFFWDMQDGFDPDTSVPHLNNPHVVNRDKMLKTAIMMVDGKEVTVYHLITFLSNVAGAVHAGKPKTEMDIILQNAQKEFGIGGLPAGVRNLLSVSRVVLKGLEPLR